MRKIEQQMLQAIRCRCDWRSENTAVVILNDGQATAVYLHGNRIATSYIWEGVRGFSVDLDTLKRWPTKTTISRLRALGVNVYVRKGQAYVDDVAIS